MGRAGDRRALSGIREGPGAAAPAQSVLACADETDEFALSVRLLSRKKRGKGEKPDSAHTLYRDRFCTDGLQPGQGTPIRS